MADELTEPNRQTVTNGTTAPVMQTAESPTVPAFRLEQELSAKREAVAARENSAKEVDQLRSQLEQATAELNQSRTRYSQDMHLIAAGFKDPSVMRFFRSEYNAALSDMIGDDKPGFDVWLEANREAPLYSVHFDRVRTQAPTQEQESTQAVADPANQNLIAALQQALTGNPNAGTGQPADTRAKDWTVEEIRKLRARNNGTLGAHKDEIMAQWRAKGIIK
jgi:uncharacterized protein (DUF3084 family)